MALLIVRIDQVCRSLQQKQKMEKVRLYCFVDYTVENTNKTQPKYTKQQVIIFNISVQLSWLMSFQSLIPSLTILTVVISHVIRYCYSLNEVSWLELNIILVEAAHHYINSTAQTQFIKNGTNSSLVKHSTLKREILALSQELR